MQAATRLRNRVPLTWKRLENIVLSGLYRPPAYRPPAYRPPAYRPRADMESGP